MSSGAETSVTVKPWPALPLDEWRDTYATLHMWLQIVGKTRLALSPPQNHWWHVALYTTARGITTSPIPYGERSFEVELDFVDHVLFLRTSEGVTDQLRLKPMSVADFYRKYVAMLRAADIEVTMHAAPTEVADGIPFADDRVHTSYDGPAAHRCWRLMSSIAGVMQSFRRDFLGKTSPIHFWWGAFDLAHTRFSGRSAPPHPGGIPNLPDEVAREGYSHECISVGWWPGSDAGPIREPAFYAYVYPEPPGCADAALAPAEAYFHPVMREWILAYEVVRRSADPEATLMQFMQSAYAAAAALGQWDRATLERAAAQSSPAG